MADCVGVSTAIASHRLRPPRRFEDRPILVFWETTKACSLSCRHCRATALPTALPGELTTAEGLQLLDQLSEFGRPTPILVLTGGDCMARRDLLLLTARARELGIVVALSPSVTPRLTPESMSPFADLGVRSVSISLDGACPATHDAVRGVSGHFDETLRALEWLSEAGFKVQVNTTVMRANVGELADIAALLQRLAVPIWEVFFLVNVGRGADVAALNAEENEQVCQFLYDASRYSVLVRTVEAPFFRRVVAERHERQEQEEGSRGLQRGPIYDRLLGRLEELLGPPLNRPLSPSVSTRDGMGVLFVGHDGSVRPSGFLPLPLGNVKERGIADIYRHHQLLLRIRSAEFGGRCGRCAFRHLCGGSRARAYAVSGDPLGEDPGCAYPAT